MHLRKLMLEDAPLMLEWMHEDDVASHYRTDFSSKKLEDVERFIRSSWQDNDNIHYAIASDNDEYMGTASLKNINIKDGIAEYATVVRVKAMGKNYAWYGMRTILRRAFNEFHLKKIYSCIYSDNKRCIRFVEKHGFLEESVIPDSLLAEYKAVKDLVWYSIDEKGFAANKEFQEV